MVIDNQEQLLELIRLAVRAENAKTIQWTVVQGIALLGILTSIIIALYAAVNKKTKEFKSNIESFKTEIRGEVSTINAAVSFVTEKLKVVLRAIESLKNHSDREDRKLDSKITENSKRIYRLEEPFFKKELTAKKDSKDVDNTGGSVRKVPN